LHIQAGGNWSHTNSITYEEKIGISVHPGYKVCYLLWGQMSPPICHYITGRLGRERAV
jgi:hypothetical protein